VDPWSLAVIVGGVISMLTKNRVARNAVLVLIVCICIAQMLGLTHQD